MAINELRAIATFAKAAELGSLRQAASAQGITPQAASLALGQLESHLGVRLFHRTTRSLSLTEEGRQFLEAAQPGLATLQRAVHGARRGREEIAGPLRIVAPRSIMLEVVWPVLDVFCRRYPLVEPDVQLDDRIGNWVEDRVDVGFRSGYPPEGGVIARRLMALQLVVCATPDYLARHGTPTRIEDLAQHRCSGFRHPTTGKPMPWEFQVGDDIVAHAIPPAFCVNDIALEARAVLGGHGPEAPAAQSLGHRNGRRPPMAAVCARRVGAQRLRPGKGRLRVIWQTVRCGEGYLSVWSHALQ